uniref:Protein dpy-30 homolog n=1 Tax=Nyssomyia neivai TaxID=330878 RepID=A0A1L8DXC8_9DIPT
MEKPPEPQKKPTRDLKSLPTRQYIDQTVAPILLKGLQTLAKERPPDPVTFLANYLLQNKSKNDENTATPQTENS